jgi:hypothetical protein
MKDSTISKYGSPIYIWSYAIVHFVYLLVFLGVFVTVPQQIKWLNTFIQIFICVILMYNFNPYRDVRKINSFDNMLIFGSAFILFTNVVLVQLTQLPVIGNYIKPIIPLVDSNAPSQSSPSQSSPSLSK